LFRRATKPAAPAEPVKDAKPGNKKTASQMPTPKNTAQVIGLSFWKKRRQAKAARGLMEKPALAGFLLFS
jgi:hypothetical protein